MGACFAVALLAADQVTTFDVAAHGCNVPTQRSRQSAQAQKRSLGKRLSHWLWNLGAHLLPGIATIAPNRTRATHSVPRHKD